MQERGISKVIVIVIAIIVIGVFVGAWRAREGTFSIRLFPKVQQVADLAPVKDGFGNEVELRDNGCGLIVTSPDLRKKLTFPLHLEGYINGCAWPTGGTMAGTVILFDGNNVALTGAIPLSFTKETLALDLNPAYFDVWFNIVQSPTSNTGRMIFRSNTANTDRGGIIIAPVQLR